VTPKGLESLNNEREGLCKQRVTVTEQMRKAIAAKDFREDAPLHAAREQKSQIEGRIQENRRSPARWLPVRRQNAAPSVCMTPSG